MGHATVSLAEFCMEMFDGGNKDVIICVQTLRVIG